jgi:hypothetical protein
MAPAISSNLKISQKGKIKKLKNRRSMVSLTATLAVQ